MQKKTIQFATVTTKNGTIQKIGRSMVEHPKVNFNNKGVKWLDESKLYRRTTNK